MDSRREMIIGLAEEHGPCSVRHLFYRSLVAKMPGIDKKHGYDKVQRLVLDQRRAGTIDYRAIVDSTRWMRKSKSYDSIGDALEQTARFYRRRLWSESEWRLEVWCESDSIASTITDVVDGIWDLPVMVCRGYSSETFAYNAADAWNDDDRWPVVLYIGDHDEHGLAIEETLRQRLSHFSDKVPEWFRVGVTWGQVEAFDLPGETPKRPYGYPLAVEAEALPPRELRRLVNAYIESYVDDHKVEVLREAEKSEREILRKMAGGAA